MKEERLEQLKKNVTATQANLPCLQINDDEIQEIMQQILLLHPTISYINLDGNNLSDQGAITLTQCLQNFNQLTKVSVQGNQIGSAGALSLYSLKKGLSTLSIFFHGNKVTNVRDMIEIERLAMK